MHSIQHSKKANKGIATDAIFNACRANPTRENQGRVSFRLIANGEHEATLRDAKGVVITIAIVDQFDI